MSGELINSIFDQIDGDKDGNITLTELNAIFQSFDKDNNGLVSRDEFVKEFSAKFTAPEDKSGKVFTKLDTDGDNEISLEEVKAFFKKMDGDGDNTVNKAEFVSYWQQLLA